MYSALVTRRLHLAFTMTFNYIFRQLTMGLALLTVVPNLLASARSGWAKDGTKLERAGAVVGGPILWWFIPGMALVIGDPDFVDGRVAGKFGSKSSLMSRDELTKLDGHCGTMAAQGRINFLNFLQEGSTKAGEEST